MRPAFSFAGGVLIREPAIPYAEESGWRNRANYARLLCRRTAHAK